MRWFGLRCIPVWSWEGGTTHWRRWPSWSSSGAGNWPCCTYCCSRKHHRTEGRTETHREKTEAKLRAPSDRKQAALTLNQFKQTVCVWCVWFCWCENCQSKTLSEDFTTSLKKKRLSSVLPNRHRWVYLWCHNQMDFDHRTHVNLTWIQILLWSESDSELWD